MKTSPMHQAVALARRYPRQVLAALEHIERSARPTTSRLGCTQRGGGRFMEDPR